MRQAIPVVLTILLLSIVSCQPILPLQEASTKQLSDVSDSQQTMTTSTAPGQEMIAPTVILTTEEVSPGTAPFTPLPRPADCPQLESRLYDLTVAENPVELAKTMGLFYEDGDTRVIVQLVTPGANTSFLTEYGAQIETQTESLVQVLVPLENLCDLSNDPHAKSVRSQRAAALP